MERNYIFEVINSSQSVSSGFSSYWNGSLDSRSWLFSVMSPEHDRCIIVLVHLNINSEEPVFHLVSPQGVVSCASP